MFWFPDVTTVLGSSSGTELDLGCRIFGDESHKKHDSCWKMKDEINIVFKNLNIKKIYNLFYKIKLNYKINKTSKQN